MGRRLPWNRQEVGQAARRRKAPTPAPTPAQVLLPKAEVTTSPPLKTILTARPPPSTKQRLERIARQGRTPSTSPPPEPPVEDYMVDGYDNDDRFRMVEDELFAIAGKFTAHLHAAEYQRLKHQAKTRNADTINSISRPVVVRMTSGVKAKHERLAKEKRRQEGLKRAIANGKRKGLDLDSEDESPWKGTSLQGLMESPTKSSIRLSRVGASSSGTRAAAGYSSNSASTQSRQKEYSYGLGSSAMQSTITHAMEDETTDDSEDLDNSSSRRSAVLARPPAPVRTPPTPENILQDRPHQFPSSHEHRHPSEITAPSRRANEKLVAKPGTSTGRDVQSDSDEDPFEAILRGRREQRASRPRAKPPNKTTKPSEKLGDIIPSFL